MKRFFTILVAAFALASCTQDVTEIIESKFEKPTYYASFADTEAEGRTYLDENLKLLWHNDDRISLFATTYNEEYAFADATGSNSGAFNAVDKDSYVTGNAISTTYAVYPYNAANAISNSEILTIHFPAEQTYMENSFGRGANTMVAAAESAESKLLPFRNAGGYLMLKLYGEGAVKSIELKGNNEEILSGAATAEAKYGYLPAITMGTEGGQTITLNCEEAVTLGATEAEATVFWLVVPPITFEQGFTITVTDAEGGTFVQATSKEVVVERNEIKSMAPLTTNFEGTTEDPEEPKPANNEIWYTNGSTTEATQPYNKNVFGATILSNLYDADKACWVITFDNEVTSIGNYAFYKSSNLISISIPNSVTKIGQSAFSKCSGLEGISIPDSVTEMGLYTFSQCSNLTKVSIGNGLAKIPTYAFQYCSNLTHITIPDGITEIESMAFYSCSSIQSITMGKGVSFVGDKALIGLSSLREINISDLSAWCMIDFGGLITPSAIALSSTKIYLNGELIEGRLIIPEGTTSIGNAVFWGYKYITDVIIPNGVVTIGTDAFFGCDNLQSVTIPESTTMIYRYAFDNCDNLTNVYCKSTTPPEFLSTYPPFGSSSECSKDLKIYVPMESVDVYKTDENWDMYASKIIGYDFE